MKKETKLKLIELNNKLVLEVLPNDLGNWSLTNDFSDVDDEELEKALSNNLGICKKYIETCAKLVEE